MYSDGYEDITAADISRVVLAQLKVRCEGMEGIKFFQGTMCDTNLPEGSIDAIIDKALLDSLICGQNGATDVAAYVVEVERLLSNTGVFIVVSHGNPEQRLPYLEQYDIDEPHYTPWVVEVQALQKPLQYEDEVLDPEDLDSLYFIYICTKQEDMVFRKQVKEQKVLLDKKKAKPKKVKAPNL